MTTDKLLKQISEEIFKAESQIKECEKMLRHGIFNIELCSTIHEDGGTLPCQTTINHRTFNNEIQQELLKVMIEYLKKEIEFNKQELIKLKDPLEIAIRIRKLQEG